MWHPKAYPLRYSNLEKPPIWVDPYKFTQMSLEDWTPRDRRSIRAIFGAYQAICRKKYFLNESAMIVFMIPYILELFPEARFIHMYRDGRAVAFSYAKTEYAKMEAEPAPYKKKGYFFL